MPAAEKNAPIYTKIWVWFHLFVVTCVCLPRVPEDVSTGKREPFGTEWVLVYNDKLKTLLQPYTWPTGFWQSWDMFAPNPSNWEGYVSAVVFYQDGTSRAFHYPRMYDLPLGIKYFKERFRKFLERAQPTQFAWNYPFFARRIALEAWKDPGNPPIKVELWRHWYNVPPTVTFDEWLTSLGRGPLFPPNPKQPDYNHVKYFTYIVPQDELRRLATL